MRIPNVSSNPIQKTSPDIVNCTLSNFIKVHANYKGRAFVTYSSSKTAQSFLALAKTFFSRLFRRNPDLHLQRTPPSISIPIPKMTTKECEQLWQFDYAIEHIVSKYAETYAETLTDLELQKFKKAEPALIAHFGEDFLEKFHEIHAASTRKKMPMADMLYQAIGAITFRSSSTDCAGVKGFSLFMKRPETAKAFESWLGSYTQVFKPEEAAKPTLYSICKALNHADANAVTHFLSVRDEALRQTMEDYPKSFLETLNRDPSSSLDQAARASVHEKYLKRFCATLDNLLALDKKISQPQSQSLVFRLEQAHQAAMYTVIKPPLNPFNKDLAFSHLEKWINEGTEKKLKEEAQPEPDRQPSPLTETQGVPKVRAQEIAKEPHKATYGDFSMERDLSQKNTQFFLARAVRGIIGQVPVIRDLRLFRPSTKRPKPSDVGNLGNVEVAPYRTHWNQRVRKVSDITKKFVIDLNSSDSKIGSKLKPCEKEHLIEIIAASPERMMWNLTLQNVSRTHPIYGPRDYPGISEFSEEFLTAMQALESEIVATIYKSAEKAI